MCGVQPGTCLEFVSSGAAFPLIVRLPDSVSQDYHVLRGALLSANSVLKRYRYRFKSDAMFSELKHVVLPQLAVRCSHLEDHWAATAVAGLEALRPGPVGRVTLVGFAVV